MDLRSRPRDTSAPRSPPTAVDRARWSWCRPSGRRAVRRNAYDNGMSDWTLARPWVLARPRLLAAAVNVLECASGGTYISRYRLLRRCQKARFVGDGSGKETAEWS